MLHYNVLDLGCYVIMLRQRVRGLMMEATSVSVVRDNKGRIVKGSTLNPGGNDARRARMLRDLQALTPRAIAKLGKLIDDPNPQVSLGAVREVLDRNLGKPKQSVTVDVTSTHVLHLQALEELAARKRAQQLETLQATVIANGATLDGKGLHDDSALTLSASDYSATVEAPRPPDPEGAAAYAPPTHSTHQNPTPPQDETP